MKTELKYNTWQSDLTNINNLFLNNDLIKTSLSNLWTEVFKDLDENTYILIQFKILTHNEELKSISYVQRVNSKEFNLLLQTFIAFWEIKSEDYHEMLIKGIVYTYKLLNPNLPIKNSKILLHKKRFVEKELNFKFNGINLPTNMDYTKWGDIHYYNEDKNLIVYRKGSKSEYHITLNKDFSNIDLKIENKILFSFKDTMLEANNLNTFKREFKNQTFIFEEGELKFKSINRKTSKIKQIKPSITLSEKFITMDIETRNINGILSPFCVSIYDGKILNSFYLSDYENSDELLKSSILSIMKRKYNGYKIYLHNFSNFDGFFLFRILTELSENIKPIINEDKFIEIKFKFSNYYLYFRDSYLLLPASLAKLAIDFKVETKGIYPYLFVNNPKIPLNYVGEVPNYSNFVNLSIEEYNNYSKNYNKDWNLKLETINYCNQDVISLFQVINKFSNIIFEEVRIDVLNYPTLPSLALAIYRCCFLKDFDIPILTGNIYNDIKNSYTGGSVDVFIPFGENIHSYDINSLYPYIMKNFLMPVGDPIYFEGDILKYNKNPFGFFYAKIEAPEDLKIPLLQKKIKFNNQTKTISPVGSWEGYYFSEELLKAKELNYKIEILKGYTFEKKYIFNDYVDFFYTMKLNSPKSSPHYTIAKLFLNSLYGKFGMNPVKEEHLVISSSNSEIYYNKLDVTNVINFNNNTELISYLENKDVIYKDDNLKNLNTSVGIASAITAYARIYMYQFKNFKNTNVYYTDTDSIAIDKKLPEIFVGNELGKFKLEYIAEKSIFLAPKVYCCKTKNEEVLKIKGFKLNKENNLKFEDFQDLLFKDKKISLKQEKWYKNISEGNIKIKNEIYTLAFTYGKRAMIFDGENKFINTKPFKLIEGEIKHLNPLYLRILFYFT